MTPLTAVCRKLVLPAREARISVLLLAASMFFPSSRAQIGYTGTSGGQNFGAQAIGSPSAVQTLNFSISAGTPVGSIAVLTSGAPNLDFADAGASTCVAQYYRAAATCLMNIQFTPTAAGTRMGAVVFFAGSNSNGTVLGSVLLTGVGVGPQTAFSPAATAVVDNVKFSSLSLMNPSAAAEDGAGNLYVLDTVSDPPSYRLVKIPANGPMVGVSYPQANGEALYLPSCIAIDGAGDLFIGDFYGRIVEVPIGGGAASAFVPEANGIPLNDPSGIAIDGAGDLFVSDFLNNRVLEVPAGGGATIALDPTVNGIPLNDPHGLAIDAAGDLFIADLANDRVVELPAGGGAATAMDPNVDGAGLQNPIGVAVDAAGDLFIADNVNRRVVEHPAGGGPAIAIDPSDFFPGAGEVYGVLVDASGNLFVVQQSAATGGRILERYEHGQPPVINFASPTFLNTVDTTDGAATVQVTNIGNQPLAVTGVAYPADFSPASGDPNACTAATTLDPGQQCDVPVSFTPNSAGSLAESVTVADNALNNSAALQAIPINGLAEPQPALVSPAPGSTLTGISMKFTWSAAAGATGYYLSIGDNGVGSNNLYNSGKVAVLSMPAWGLPSNGETIYVRLNVYFGALKMHTDYTLTAWTKPATSSAPWSACIGNHSKGSGAQRATQQKLKTAGMTSPSELPVCSTPGMPPTLSAQ